MLETWVMKDYAHKSIRIILPIALFFLFSHANAQQKQIETENAEFYKNRGLACLEKRQYDKAILDFNSALRINADDAYTLYCRGRTFGEQCKYALAISDCTKALDLNPGFGEAYFYRGLLYHAKGRYDQAIADYTRLLR